MTSDQLYGRPTSGGSRTPPPRDPRLVRRLRLTRADGLVYLERWGLSHPRVGGVLVHRMNAADPGGAYSTTLPEPTPWVRPEGDTR